jgi:predicted nuclease of predicted toxin-antitoxin system
MRWLVDECVSARLVGLLRAAGHDVAYVIEDSPSTHDTDVLEWALREQRLLLTHDKDFGELIFGGLAQSSFGVVLLRIPDTRADLVWPRLQEAIDRFGEHLFGAFTVIGETRFRTRQLTEE